VNELIGVVLAALLSSGFLQERGWRDIAPLHSTRTDVERLLGSPKESRGVASTFQAKDGRVRVFYSSGFCKKGAANDWNVPPDTVVSLTFEPNKALMVADLKLDKTKYERVRDPHLQSGVYYFNQEDGIRISARVLGDGEEVQTITYEPATKDYYLRCPNGTKQPLDSNEQMYLGLGLAFDEYSDLPFEDEKPRLDNFAIYLQKQEPTFKGYIIVYSGPKMSSGKAQRRAKRAKDYLVKVRRIDEARIVTIDGGYREQFEVKLYALPSSKSPPSPNPRRNE